MLICDLLLLSEEPVIRNSHPHFLQACNNVKKGVKASLTGTFKEILSAPLSTLSASKPFSGFLNFLQTRLLPHNRVVSIPAVIEAFLITLIYKGLEDDQLTESASKALAVFWASTDKNGSNLTELAKNCAVIIDRCLKTDHLENGKNTTAHEGVEKDEDAPQAKGESSARDKIEDLVMDRQKRVLFPAGLKFGYVSTKLPPIMIGILSQTILELETESMTVDIEPVVALVRRCSEISLELVAYSEDLTEMRRAVQFGVISLSRNLIKAFAGSYYDLYPILFEDANWKAEDLSVLCSTLTLHLDLFEEFPRNYHQTIIFEEPNLLAAVPKLLVWTSKHQIDNSTSHLLKSKKLSQNTPRLTDAALTLDWIDISTKKALPETVYTFRKLTMRCE
jgi:hypothetical protein